MSEKLAAKFPATTLSSFVVKIACCKDAFLGIFEQEASPVEGRAMSQKDQLTKPKNPDIGRFLQSLISGHAQAKML